MVCFFFLLFLAHWSNVSIEDIDFDKPRATMFLIRSILTTEHFFLVYHVAIMSNAGRKPSDHLKLETDVGWNEQ